MAGEGGEGVAPHNGMGAWTVDGWVQPIHSGGGAPRRLQVFAEGATLADAVAYLATAASTAISRPAAGSFVLFDLSPSLEVEWGGGEEHSCVS